MRRNVSSALALVAALGCGAAHAELVDGGGVTIDTSTGLEWLDLTTTQGIDFKSIITGYEGFTTTDGWTIANTAQVQQLAIDAMGAPNNVHCEDSCDLGPRYELLRNENTSTDKISLQLALMSDLGFTETGTTDGITGFTSRGYLNDQGANLDPTNPYAAQAQFNLQLSVTDPSLSAGDWGVFASTSEGAVRTDASSTNTTHQGAGQYGTFLVREAPAADVPEPATWALFGAGLIGIALTRRRRAAA